MIYQDFELEVRPLGGRDYELIIIRSPGGEAREQSTLPFSELQLKNHLLNVEVAMLRSSNVRRMALNEEEQAVQEFGEALFEFLFPGELRGAYRTSLNRVHAVGQGLRLRLRFNDPKLAFLPWEFLFDTNRRAYVCLSSETPLVRYIEAQRTIPPLKVTPPLRILGMVVNPQNYPQQLDITREKQRVEEAVKELVSNGLVELHWLKGQAYGDLQRELRRDPWHIFHFIGHGSFDTNRDEGQLIFANHQGNAAPFAATNLAMLLADHKPLRLAVLNACEGAKGGTELFSGTAPILVSRGLPAVIAMQYAITDKAAIEFARAFYESLVDGYPVDASMSEARKAMNFAFAQTVEWGVPVLYMRSQDGVLFTVEEQTTSTTPPPVKAEELPPLSSQPKPEPPILVATPEQFRQESPKKKTEPNQSPNQTNTTPAAQPTQPPFWQQWPFWTWGLIGILLLVVVGFSFNALFAPDEQPDVSATQTAVAQAIPDTPTATSSATPTAATEPEQTTPTNTPIPEPARFVPPPIDGIEWIEIPAGPFLMGAAEDDTQAQDNEWPPDTTQAPHTVTLDTFWIAKTEITHAQYKAFIDATGHRIPSCVWDENGIIPDGLENHPVICVSWTDAVAYTKWLSEENGLQVTLPSEAEWEKAARGADDTRIYPWLGDFDGNRLNYCDSNCKSEWRDTDVDDGYQLTAPVGSFPNGESPYGVLDMSGNVWEWTRSIYDQETYPYPYNPADGREAMDASGFRVLRGGSWGFTPESLRVSDRNRLDTDALLTLNGFRVVVLRPPSQL